MVDGLELMTETCAGISTAVSVVAAGAMVPDRLLRSSKAWTAQLGTESGSLCLWRLASSLISVESCLLRRQRVSIIGHSLFT
jgi:hypothetical protein